MVTPRKPIWESFAYRIPTLVGTPVSLVAHTVFFAATFLIAPYFGFDKTINLLTNIVSLEAIYLTVFVQMSMNKQHKRLKDIEDDIDEILEDTISLTEEQKEEIKQKLKNRK